MLYPQSLVTHNTGTCHDTQVISQFFGIDLTESSYGGNPLISPHKVFPTKSPPTTRSWSIFRFPGISDKFWRAQYTPSVWHLCGHSWFPFAQARPAGLSTFSGGKAQVARGCRPRPDLSVHCEAQSTICRRYVATPPHSSHSSNRPKQLEE